MSNKIIKIYYLLCVLRRTRLRLLRIRLECLLLCPLAFVAVPLTAFVGVPLTAFVDCTAVCLAWLSCDLGVAVSENSCIHTCTVWHFYYIYNNI